MAVPLSILFILLQSADFLSTIWGLRAGLVEANPWLGSNPFLYLPLKVLAVILVLLVAHRFLSLQRRTWFLYMAVVISLLAPLANGVQIVLHD